MPIKQSLREAFAEAGVSDEQFNKLEEIFTDDELQDKLASGFMKAKDYTTKTQAVAEEKRRLEEEQQEWNEGRDYIDRQNARWKTDTEKRINEAIAAAAKSRLYGAALESKLQTIATQYGENIDDLLADVKEMRTKEPEKKTAQFDEEEFNKRYLGKDEFTRVANSFGAYPTQLRDFERDYEREFGKPYDGSLHELVTSASQEVEKLRARGQNVDLFSHIRTKLDFSGQKQRNAEAAKTATQKEREDWEKKRSEEIERDLRSKYAVENPTINRPQREAWRDNLSATKRQEAKRPERQATPMDTFKRQQDIHRAFEERQAKSNAA